ncbi:MAG: hypothetical protein JNL43_09590 [Flavobacteriales bacterium]|nr:hypothetical protein [Flavobacteriales bacterium]
MRTLRLVALLCIAAVVTSFTLRAPSIHSAIALGTYGVQGCGESADEGRHIALTLNEDGTFHYVNDTDPKAEVDVVGTWESAGRTITLRTLGENGAVLATWTKDKDCNCIRSRKGLLFLRLCHLEGCE